MGNAPARSEARKPRHRHRERSGSRTLGQGLHVAASIALLVGATQVVGRQVGTTRPAGLTGARGRHCVARLGVPVPAMRCFGALNAAVAAATDGRVHLLAGIAGAAVATIPLNDGIPTADYHVVSIEWTGSNYTGASLTWQAPLPCGHYASSSMPRGWNDAIRSVAQYSDCATTLSWDVNFGGATLAIGVNASVPDLGSFDANASSQKWCPSPCS
ncbi:MAG TPA: hypothetical protein VJ010_06050 [Actinomycetota bacterium]|nr:hypothetical protein [Actinomycetota bacterium]